MMIQYTFYRSHRQNVGWMSDGEADRRSRLLSVAHGIVFLLALFFVGGVQAQSGEHHTLGDDIDCSNASVDYANNPNLTRQEKIALMDKALLQSLNKYEGCQQLRSRSSASGSGASGGSSAESAGSIGSGSSTASSEMSGTQTSTRQQEPIEKTPNKPAATKHAQSVPSKGGGKLPSDIPSVDNDSTLEAQIRQAAMQETDPTIKVKLWNEYRKYKGLPAQ